MCSDRAFVWADVAIVDLFLFHMISALVALGGMVSNDRYNTVSNFIQNYI